MLSPVARDDMRLRLPEIAALAALGLAVLAGVDLVEHGPGHGTLPFLGALGFAVMMDVVSVSLMMTVSFVGWVVLRFSRVALDGETRHAGFMAFMSLVLAGVILLVTAGTLTQLVIGWIGIGVALRPLLLFYHDRPRAQRAAKKKAFFSMISVAALTAACLWMASAFGTTEIAAIRAAIEIGDVPDHLWGIALLLAVAAIVKSALIPTHGWLTEVMEAPTPVSALLHAGVVASGGFLLIRFADLMIAVPGVMAVLALVGGFSALIGAAVALTQPSVKTALAWSTCAQMGFMILQCGLALFPLALLHIIAHALYKAHAFLGSGSAVEAVNAIRRPGPVAVPDVRAVGRAFGLSLAIFVAVGLVFGIASKAPQAVALGAILVFGVAYLMAQALADAAPRPLTRRTGAMAGAATLAYFAFHAGADWLTAGTLPPPPAPDGLAWAVMALTVPSFALAAFAQATFPLWADHPAARGMRVHLMNGLYLNALADRFAGRWSSKEI
ncbi:MAG: proton-conducting transporter membrane subunit [Pseudomonadota bacterium]